MGTAKANLEPTIFKEGKYTLQQIEEFKKKNEIHFTYDIYEQQLQEYFDITHPNLLFSDHFKIIKAAYMMENLSGERLLKGDWIYFPWNMSFIHMIAERKYFELCTNRNQQIITSDEQERLSKVVVGIAGLSIGGNMAITLAQSRIASVMKLADNDILSTTNLNRMRARVQDIGRLKINVISDQIYEVNPYMQVIKLTEGLNRDNISSFLVDSPRPCIIIDALDDFEVKVRLRLLSKQTSTPVLMVTSLGDTLLVDIERYDLDKNLAIFNGRIGKTPEEILAKSLTEEDKKKYAIAIVEKANVPIRALETVQNIGHRFVGRPQINSTVTIGAGVIAYLVKEITLGRQVKSGRTLVKLDIFS